MKLHLGTAFDRPIFLKGIRFYGIASKRIAIGFWLRPKNVID